MAEKPHPLTTFNLLVRLAIVTVACGTLVGLVGAAFDVWHSVKAPFSTTRDVGRAVLRMEKPRPDGEPSLEESAGWIAAGMAIDLEKERSDLLRDARTEYVDIVMRTRERLPGLSYREIITKAVTWVPDDWEYSSIWQDRDESVIRLRRSATVSELVPFVLERLKHGAGEGCAAKIIRPKFHVFGWMGGESKAAKVIATYPQDPRLIDRGFKTGFYCLPPRKT
jgi:hypothetical protein